MMRLISTLLAAVFILGSTGKTAIAQSIIHVPVDQPTIQAGINAAQNGDTVLVSPGTYNENINFHGKAITVTSGASAYGSAQATITGRDDGAVVTFDMNESAGAVLNGFILTNGHTSVGSNQPGGGVLVDHASPTIQNNVITNNSGCGMLVVNHASPLIQGNDVKNSLYTDMENLFPCTAADGGGNPGVGIVIQNSDKPSIIGNVIEDNAYGVVDSANQDTEGAGITISSTDTVLIQNNIIRNNFSTSAAAILGQAQHLVLVQNLIYGNSNADLQVIIGGLDFQKSPTVIETNNTIVGGGESVSGDFGPSTITNNIFYNPTPLDVGHTTIKVDALSCGFPAGSQLPNIQNNDTFTAGDGVSQAPCSLGSGNLLVPPSLVNLQTSDFHETASSATVVTGMLTAPALPFADLDGKARTVCGRVDMGAYELHPKPPIAVTSSQNPSVGGTDVTFTANLTGNCNMPTGTVTFYDGATPLGTQTLSTGASASFTTSALTVGLHNITVGYPGDFNFEASSSAMLVQVVTGYPTTTTLATSPNPASAFGPITLSSTVTASVSVPHGTVTFTAGGTILATATLTANGQAMATITSLGTGSYTIVATYTATTTYAASSSAAVNETVVGAESVTVLSATPKPATAGQTVNFTATVKAAQGSAIPTGTVVFTDGTATLGTTALNASGAATFSTATLTPGTHTITATYSGGANFNPSSASITETITVVATTTSLTASPNPAGAGQAVTLAATVLSNTSGIPPAGVVTFLDGGTAIGTGALNTAGIATFSTSTLAVGTHSLTATYPGVGNLGGSTSPAVSETIIASAFSLSLTPSTLTLRPGQTGTVTVQLASAGGYAGTLALSSGSLPTFVTGAFGPASVALPSNGTGISTFTLSTQVTQAQVQTSRPGRDVMLAGGLLTCLLAPFGFRRRRWISLALLFGLTTVLLTASGCTNLGEAIHTVAPGTYTIPITAMDVNGNQKTSGVTLVIAQ